MYIKMARTNSHLIDSKGRLFGKINVIDALVFLFIILVVVAGLRFAFFGPEPQMTMVKLELKNQPDYIYDNLHVGDILLLNDNNNSMIVDILVTSKKGELRDLLLLVKLDTVKKNENLFFDDQELRIGKRFKLITSLVESNSAIIDFDSTLDEIVSETLEIKMMSEQVKPWIADALTNGAKQIVQGETVAILIDNEAIPAKTIITSEDGDIFLREHPINKDILTTLNIVVQKTNGAYYFQGSELYVGNSLTFYFDGITLSGQIINIG